VIKAAIAAANTTYDTVRSASMQAVDLAEHSFKASSAVASQADKRAASRAAKKP